MKKVLSFALMLVMLAAAPVSVFAATQADTGKTYETVAITASINDSGTVGTMASTIGYTRSYSPLFTSTTGGYICTILPNTQLQVISVSSNWSYVMILSGNQAGTYGFMLSGFIQYA